MVRDIVGKTEDKMEAKMAKQLEPCQNIERSIIKDSENRFGVLYRCGKTL